MSASREIYDACANLQPLPKSFSSQSFATCHHPPVYRVSLVAGVAMRARGGGNGEFDLRDA